MIPTKLFNTQDLVLKVKQNYDPVKLKLHEWERFLNILCANRNYQKEAIKTAILFLASGSYQNIDDLVKENARSNPDIAARYHSTSDYLKKLQMPGRLSATIDLATGTGKSFVIYGIAQIALGLGLIDKVLVLCPSLTIKDGLTKKFMELSSNKKLLETIPSSAHLANPSITNANETIQAGDICVSNVHAVYGSSSSSIFDSLGFGKGQSCLVLNDEAHHVFNKVEGQDDESKSLKKWKEFLQDETYGFKYIIGLTGTAYVDNEYFNDVIYRYSLRQAIENRFVKTVFYVHKDESSNENEKFQKIYQNHQTNKDKYSQIKPITILIAKDIKFAKQLHTRLVEFLMQKGEGSEEYISKNKVLIVTSHSDHKAQLLKLPYVDEDQHIEWIISVAMLTEGWDVKNVFQIVPMEEKAFNSKLLIAQVLGRGLRLPEFYPQAQVTVFNHDSWSSKITELVNEILEIELRLRSTVLQSGERAKFHFNLYNFDYSKTATTVNSPESKVFNYKDYIELTSETFEHENETMLVDIEGNILPVIYKIEKERFPVSEIVDKIIYEFETREWEGVTLKLKDNEYTKNELPPRSEIENLVKKSMERVGIEGEFLGKGNRQAIFSTFNTLLRKASKSVIYEKVPNPIQVISTKNRETDSISMLSLRQNTSVYYTSDYLNEIINEDTLLNLQDAIEDGKLQKQAVIEVTNLHLFKTPVDLLFVSHEPERKFVNSLCKIENAQKIDAWIKSTSQSFYSISYTITTVGGKHTNQHLFNPDFFLLVKKDEKEYIIVIETKADGDASEENKAKYKYAIEHFKVLNEQLKVKNINQEYIFHFISPSSYSTFFDYLRTGMFLKFTSELENQLLFSQE